MANDTTTTKPSLAERSAQAEEAQRQWKADYEAGKFKKSAQQVATPPKPKAKPWQKARLVNERKMRDAILVNVQRNRWNRDGIRKLSRLAGVPRWTGQTTLNRMADDEQEHGRQIIIDTKWGQGRCFGVFVVLKHPAWSDHKHGQLAPILAGQHRITARQL
jgi:hypothetical protein